MEREWIFRNGREWVSENGILRAVLLEGRDETKSVLLRLTAGSKYIPDLHIALEQMLSHLFHKGEVFKVSCIVSRFFPMEPLLKTGFSLEGVLKDFSYEDSMVTDDFIFGITSLRGLEPSRKDIRLEGDRVVIEVADPTMAEDFHRYYQENREFLKPYEPRRKESFYTLEGQMEELKERYSMYLNGIMIPMAIYLDDRLIGRINISNIVMGSFRSCMIGYGLHKDLLGRGLMSEAMGLVTDFCFHGLGLHRVEASTLLDNHASQKVLLNNGFVRIGVNPSYLMVDNEWRDHYTFVKTSDM